jgi:hypothetical protein
LTGLQLQTLQNAQHYRQIPVVRIFRFGQLFVREMGIQVADGWGWFLFHPLTLEPRRKYGRRVNLPEMASLHTFDIFNLVAQSNGLPNAVSVMGTDCSERQAEMIVSVVKPAGRVWFMPDGNEAGERCAQSILLKVA